MKCKIAILVGSMLLAACAGSGPIGGPGIQVTRLAELPPPNGIDPASDARSYLIGPFDKLKVAVFGVEELTAEVQVDGSGRIALPLAGSILVADRTPEEVAELIAQRLKDGYVRNPQVAVNLEEAVSHVVTLEGEVAKPGAYPVLGNMTLMRAIAHAEGTTEFAELDDVIIFRTVNGQRMAGVYNLRAIRRGNYEDPEVYADDLIVVGESPTRRMFRDVLQAAPAILTPLVYVFTR